MEIPANNACIEIALDGKPYPVIALQGDERLSRGFCFRVDIQAGSEAQVTDLIGRLTRARLRGLVKTMIDESNLIHVDDVHFDFSDEHPGRPWTLRAFSTGQPCAITTTTSRPTR